MGEQSLFPAAAVEPEQEEVETRLDSAAETYCSVAAVDQVEAESLVLAVEENHSSYSATILAPRTSLNGSNLINGVCGCDLLPLLHLLVSATRLNRLKIQ